MENIKIFEMVGRFEGKKQKKDLEAKANTLVSFIKEQ